MPESAYPNTVCAHGHVEVDRRRERLRCEKPLTTQDVVAVHVNRDPRHPRAGGENAHADDLATIEEWGPANTGQDEDTA